MTTRISMLISGIFLALFIVTAFYTPSKLSAATTRHVVEKVWYSYDKVKIYINPARDGSKPKYKYNMIDGNRFYIDIFNSRVINSLNSAINLDDVLLLRRAQFSPETSRVVIQFNKKGIKPKVVYVNNPSPHILVFWKGISTSVSRIKYRILIDPGHGGRDVGAIGPNKKTKEKNVTLDIALKLEKLLQKRDDVIVELTRRTDKELKPSMRRAIAHRWRPDIFISIHANSSIQNSNLNQTEIYYYDRKSLHLAKVVRDELVDELERSEGHIRREPFTVIYKNPARYGSVLVESCYLSSKSGENFLRQDWYRHEIAKGLSNSIAAFLNAAN